MLLNRRTLILAGLAVAAVSGCSVESRVEFLTGTAAYVAQNPDNPLAKVAATASQQIGWRLLVQSDRTKKPAAFSRLIVCRPGLGRPRGLGSLRDGPGRAVRDELRGPGGRH